jgi:hypothetical protein
LKCLFYFSQPPVHGFETSFCAHLACIVDDVFASRFVGSVWSATRGVMAFEKVESDATGAYDVLEAV